MALNLRQLHAGDCDALVAVWLSIVADPLEVPSGDELRRMIRQQPQLSLAVLDEQAVIGAALCQLHPPSAWQHLLILPPNRHDPELIRQAIDKTVVKLRSRGLSRCQMRMVGTKTMDDVWPVLRWSHRPQFLPGNTSDAASSPGPQTRCVNATNRVASKPHSAQLAGVPSR